MTRSKKFSDDEILRTLETPQTMVDAAAALDISKRTLTARVRNLIDKGTVKETINHRDMRRPMYVTEKPEVPA